MRGTTWLRGVIHLPTVGRPEQRDLCAAAAEVGTGVSGSDSAGLHDFAWGSPRRPLTFRERQDPDLMDASGQIPMSVHSGARGTADPVGLEYTIVAATCFFSQHVRPLGSDLVLVRESAEDLFAADPVLGKVDWLRRPGVSLSRRELAEGTVRPSCVVVPQVLGQHLAQMVFIDDQ